MKVFKVVQRQYAMLGISSSNQWNQNNLFNERVLFICLIYVYAVGLYTVYIIRVASGFMEYVDCICATSATIMVFISFAAIVFRRNKLFRSIANIEKLIDTSESIPIIFYWT